MDIRALRADLYQKSKEAQKTHLSEDKINVTFSGIKGDQEASRYKELAEVLQVQVDILEAVLEEAKKAKKDYDGDGKVESGTDEWRGSRNNAIQAAMKKKTVSEAVVAKARKLAKKKPDSPFIDKAIAMKLGRADEAEANRDLYHGMTRMSNLDPSEIVFALNQRDAEAAKDIAHMKDVAKIELARHRAKKKKKK